MMSVIMMAMGFGRKKKDIYKYMYIQTCITRDGVLRERERLSTTITYRFPLDIPNINT